MKIKLLTTLTVLILTAVSALAYTDNQIGHLSAGRMLATFETLAARPGGLDTYKPFFTADWSKAGRSNITATPTGRRIEYTIDGKDFSFDLTFAEGEFWSAKYHKYVCDPGRLGNDPEICPPAPAPRQRVGCGNVKLSPGASAHRTQGMAYVKETNAATGVITYKFEEGSKLINNKRVLTVRDTPLASALSKQMAGRKAAASISGGAETKVYKCIATDVMAYPRVGDQELLSAVSWIIELLDEGYTEDVLAMAECCLGGGK